MYCRLKKEEEDWNQLFQDLESKAEDAERYFLIQHG